MAHGRYDVPVLIPHETELAELAQDVNTLAQALAETESRRVRLLGEVAHEIRTPLTVIDGYVEAMIDGVLPAAADELSQVSEEVRRLRRLSEDLTTLSKAEEGQLVMVRQEVDIRTIVTTAVERLRPQADDAEVALVVDTGPDRLRVQVDPDRIAQVVTNLLGNALRATEAGGRVGVSTSMRDGEAMITVVDTGIGIEANDLDHIFERFYRAHTARSGSDTGSGIGLTIARGIVEAHGGSISVDSAGHGRGATFTVRLPAN